jgi:hypothetical protein
LGFRPSWLAHGGLSVKRVPTIVVSLATAWFTAAIGWGLCARVGAGHDAVVAARAIVAENMLTWHIWGPVRSFTLDRPEPNLYYAHHPWGMFWLITAFARVLGSHAYVPRLVAVLMSAATPPLLYGIGRALWGSVPGALAAMAYAVLPIALSFGNFPGFEVPLVFGCLLTTWGYLRFAKRWERRWLAVSLLGVLWTANTDWEAYVFLGIVLTALVLALVASKLFRRRLPSRLDVRRFAVWWVLAVCIASGTLLAYILYFRHIHMLGELLRTDAERSHGHRLPLGEVLRGRRYWIDVCFTPVAILVGKIALPIFLVRVLLVGRILEIFPLAIFVMAAVQYVKFKSGADVHIYWPMPFAPYWSLSVGLIAASGSRLARWALARVGGSYKRDVASLVVLVFIGMILLAVLPDGIDALRFERMTGGRFNEKGARIYREVDKAQALEWMAPRMQGHTVVRLHKGMRINWAQEWALHRPVGVVDVVPTQPSETEDRYFVGDLAFLGAADQRTLADAFHMIVLGPYVFVDRAEPHGPADGFVFDERQPEGVQWYLSLGVDPVRTVRADPWYTWQLRDAYGQSPNPVPRDAPRTLDDVSMAHNAAIAAGDIALAKSYEKQLVDALGSGHVVRFSDGIGLLGEQLTAGVAPELALYFLAPGPAETDYEFKVESILDRKRALSLVPPDDVPAKFGAPFTIPPTLWKKGFIYVDRVEIRFRPGNERFYGGLASPDRRAPPQTSDGSGSVLLLGDP